MSTDDGIHHILDGWPKRTQSYCLDLPPRTGNVADRFVALALAFMHGYGVHGRVNSTAQDSSKLRQKYGTLLAIEGQDTCPYIEEEVTCPVLMISRFGGNRRQSAQSHNG